MPAAIVLGASSGNKRLAVRKAIKSGDTAKPSAGLQSGRKNLGALPGLLEPSSDEL
jgi:hypothetical protein